MESKDIQAIKAIQRTFTCKTAEVQHLNYSLQRRRERYIIIHIWKIAQHMVPNIDGTMGDKIKARKHPRHGTLHYSVSNNQKSSTIPSRKCNNCSWASFVQLVAKISKKHQKCSNWKIQIWARQISGALSWWTKNAQLCHRIRKQQHLQPPHSSEGSRNLPKWWSHRLGLGTVLAASKPLQVTKYLFLMITFYFRLKSYFIRQTENYGLPQEY